MLASPSSATELIVPARRRFSRDRMTARYLAVYERLAKACPGMTTSGIKS